MGKLLRCITTDATVTISVIDATDIVNTAQEIHETSAVVTAALGRTLAGASMMGNMMKNEQDTLTIHIDGNGPIGKIVVVSDALGNVRGYAQNTVVELPLNEQGKLDVGTAIGHQGTLSVVKDLGLKEPFGGTVPIVSGEIAEDITNYYAVSEQTPTVCALGVLVNPDLSVQAAGGFLINVLPFTPDDVIDKLERCITNIPSVTQMMTQGMTVEEIARYVLREFELDVLDETVATYKCTCSRERMKRALVSLPLSDLEELSADESVEIVCDFCNKKYQFKRKEIAEIIAKMKAEKIEKNKEK